MPPEFDDSFGSCPICGHPGGECRDSENCPYWSPEAQRWFDDNWRPGNYSRPADDGSSLFGWVLIGLFLLYLASIFL